MSCFIFILDSLQACMQTAEAEAKDTGSVAIHLSITILKWAYVMDDT